MAKKIFHEDAEAQALWQWAQHIPLLRDHLYHIPNGGKRGMIEAAMMKGMGVRKGVSDYHLPIARKGYIGLWIELKAPLPHRSRITDEQRDWIQRMRSAGHAAFICLGCEEAMERIKWYLAESRGD